MNGQNDIICKFIYQQIKIALTIFEATQLVRKHGNISHFICNFEMKTFRPSERANEQVSQDQ